VLSPTLLTVRLFLHVLAASVWVGGQIVLVGLVPAIRASYPEATTLVAKAYGRVAWPAFAVVVVTGVWNLAEIPVTDTGSDYQITLLLKITLAIVSGAAAAVHQLGRSKVALAVGGAVGFLAALAAMYLGFLLRTGT
jgi:putative copper export protein